MGLGGEVTFGQPCGTKYQDKKTVCTASARRKKKSFSVFTVGRAVTRNCALSSAEQG